MVANPKPPAWANRLWRALREGDFTAPLRWKRAARVAVIPPVDPFHVTMSDDDLDRMFGLMAAAHEQTFLVPTRHLARARTYLAEDRREKWAYHGGHMCEDGDNAQDFIAFGEQVLPHVWIGAQVDNQVSVAHELPVLCDVRCAHRFALVDPFVGPVDLSIWLYSGFLHAPHPDVVDWVICAGDVGTFSRMASPFSLDLARALRDQCARAEKPFFLTKLGRRPVGEWGKGKLPQCNERPGRSGEWILRSRDGLDPKEWPKDLRVQEIPATMPQKR
jgi:protein gp37